MKFRDIPKPRVSKGLGNAVVNDSASRIGIIISFDSRGYKHKGGHKLSNYVLARNPAVLAP